MRTVSKGFLLFVPFLLAVCFADSTTYLINFDFHDPCEVSAPFDNTEIIVYTAGREHLQEIARFVLNNGESRSLDIGPGHYLIESSQPVHLLTSTRDVGTYAMVPEGDSTTVITGIDPGLLRVSPVRWRTRLNAVGVGGWAALTRSNRGPSKKHSIGRRIFSNTPDDFAWSFAPDQDSITFMSSNAPVPPKVYAVPWRGSLPHEIYNGRRARLKAVAVGGSAALTQYKWDLSDGYSTGWHALSNPYAIELDYTFPSGSVGQPWTGTVTVRDASGFTASAAYNIVVRPDNLDTRRNIAIDDALWYLHKAMIRNTLNGNPTGYWRAANSLNQYFMGATAMSVMAFQNMGHLPTGSPDNPYTETVQRALNYLFGNLQRHTFTEADKWFDMNNNGYGLKTNTNHTFYDGGIVLMAIAGARAPSLTVSETLGIAEVRGRTYREIAQEMSDYFGGGQYEIGNGAGGWRYTYRQYPDQSAVQWPVLGMHAAEEHYDIQVHDLVKTRLRDVWLVTCQNPDGGFGYTNNTLYKNMAKTSAGLACFWWVGRQQSDEPVVRAMNYVRNNWNANDHYNGNVGRFYTMYGIMKAARLAVPEIEKFGDYDWYNIYSTWITSNQLSDGSWNDTDPWIGGYLGPHMRTSMAVLVMTTAVLTEPPVASFTITPNPADIGTPITFDASQSYDPNDHQLTYYWNFGDGSTAEGMIVTHEYDARDSFSAVLTVTNNAVPPVSGLATQTVYITPPNHPPVSVPGGPYFGWIGPVVKLPVTLDGSASWDPNAPLDSITKYEWELDGVYPYDFAEGNTPIVQYVWSEPGIYDVALRVTDDPDAPFDNAGLSTVTWTTVEISLDTTPPSVDLAIMPAAPDGLAGWYLHTPVITITAADDKSGVKEIRYRWDDQPEEQIVPGDVVNLLPATGSSTLYYYAVDNVSNASVTQEFHVKVDLYIPTITAQTIPPADGANGWHHTQPEVHLNTSGSHSPIVLITYSWDGVDEQQHAGSSIVLNASPGISSLVFSTTNEAGRRSGEETLIVKYDNSNPEANLELSGNLLSGSLYQGNVLATLHADAGLSGLDSATYAINGGAAIPFSNLDEIEFVRWGAYTLELSVASISGKSASAQADFIIEAGPVVVSQSVEGHTNQNVSSIILEMSKPVAGADARSADTYELVHLGPDGLPGGGDDVQFDVSPLYIDSNTDIELLFTGNDTINLYNWSEKDYTNGTAGDWRIEQDGASVKQYKNGDPTFYVSDFDFINRQFTGRIKVETTSDDDFIGLAFGIHLHPVSGLPDSYYLLSWKRAMQTHYSATGERGFNLTKVTNISTRTLAQIGTLLWGSKDTSVTDNIEMLDYDYTNGWASNVEYDFSVRYQSNGQIDIVVRRSSDGAVQWQTSVVDSVPLGAGPIAFYNFSQAAVRYSGLQQAEFLPDGKYQLTVVSGSPGIRDENGTALDGNNDGIPGDDYISTFVIDRTSPAVKSTLLEPSKLIVTFYDAGGIDENTISDVANYTLVRSGGDATFNEGNEIEIPIASVAIQSPSFGTTQAIILFASPLPNELYKLVIDGSETGVLDLAGNTLLAGTYEATIALLTHPADVAVDLPAAFDSGPFDDDNITNIVLPCIEVTVNKPGVIKIDYYGDGIMDEELTVSESGTYSFTTPFSADGIHLIYVELIPAADASVSDQLHITIDTATPHTAIMVGPPEPDGEDGWYVSPVTITLTATDVEPSSGVSLYYRWNDEDFIKADTLQVELQAPYGITTLFYYSADLAGNSEDVKQVTIKKLDSAFNITVTIVLKDLVAQPVTRTITFVGTDNHGDPANGEAEVIATWQYQMIFVNQTATIVIEDVPLEVGYLSAKAINSLRRKIAVVDEQANFTGDKALKGGDANNDNVVSMPDMQIARSQFGTSVGELSADFTGDGIVDIDDISVVRANWGKWGDSK